MSELSRRAFMSRAAVATAAGVAATSGIVALPGLIAAAAPAVGSKPLQVATKLDLSSVGQDVIAHVEDASTGERMKRFYGYLKTGKTKDEALRLAQIDLIRSPNYAQPRDWAAFELIGDWE